ncbi:MAG: hypothetical protein V4569_04435 [Pseudomonadota bacterium]
MTNPYADAAADLATEQPANRYATGAADLANDQRSTLRTSVHNAAPLSPDQAASAVRLGRQTSLPVDVVQRNLPAVQQRATIERVDTDTALSPVLRNRYTEPAFAAVAHDDSAQLARVEQSAYGFGNALRKGAASAKLTLDFLADQMAKTFGADRTETQRILRETGGFYVAQGSDPGLSAAGERAKVAGGGTWYGTLLNLPGEVASEQDPFGIVGRFLTEQLPSSLLGFGLGAAATAPLRAAVTNRVASALVAKGVNTSIAGAAGNGTAVVVSSLGTNYQEGLGKGLEPTEAASRAWTKTLAEVPANAVAGAAMGLKIGPGPLSNIFSQAAVQGAGGGVGAVQAAHSVGEKADPVEVALEILGEAVSAGPEVVGVTASRIAGSRTVKTAEAAQAAVTDAQTVGEIIKAADQSALKKRDAQSFAEFVQQVQPEAVVYIAPEHLAGVDLSAAPAVAAQLAEAQATGGDVQVSLADLVAHLPGEQLLPNLRTAPESMTLSEAERFDGPTELASELSEPESRPDDGNLIQSADEARMAPGDWDAYLGQAAESAQSAVEYRDSRNLRDMEWLAKRKTEATVAIERDALAARSEIEPAVVSEVQARPIYAAQRFLATPEGKATHPDAAAELFGFDSADSMRRAIAQAEPFDAVVRALTDERMLDQHPDIADAIAQERSAEAMIADRARERFLATEAAALSRAVGNKVLLAQEARAYAEQSIARRTVRSVRPAQFKAAAARAARDAAKAFRQGNTAEAAQWKQRQVLQTALETEATSVADEIAKALIAFRRMVSKADDGARDGNLADAARAILAQYGLAASDKTAADYLARVENYDPELHADLVMLLDGLPAPVAEHRDMTVADFRVMRDRVDAVWSLAKSTREIEIDGQKVDIAEAADAMAMQLAGQPAAKGEKIVGRNEKLDLRIRLAGMRAALRRVEFWADARDGGDSQGPFRKYMWQPVSEAVTKYRADKNLYVGRFLELLKTIEPTLKPGKIAAPELGDGVVFADRSALIHALLHTGNESNLRKLLLGYQWAVEREDGSLDKSRWDALLSRLHAEKRITKTDWDFVQATWNLLEEMKPASQKAHKSMFGHYFSEITADAVQTPFGELAGGYVPALTDRLLVSEGRAHGAMDDLLAGQNSPMFPAVGRGFTKARIEDYTKPLALDLRLLPAHIDKVARFAALGPTLRDTARLVVRNKSFRMALDAVDPTAAESMLVPWLKRTATQTLNKAPESQADRAVARIANTVRNRTGLLMMSANVVNTLQQVTGLSVAALRVSPRHLAGGMLQLVRNPGSTGRAINELSAWMSQRTDDSARHVEQTINELILNPNLVQRAEGAGLKYGYALQQAAQNVIDRTVWLGAYRQAQLDGKEDGAAVREADSAVRMTQSSFAPEDASKVEHAGAFTRLFLQFYSFFNGQANLIATEAQNAKGKSARLALVYLLGFAVPAFLADVIGKGMKGELGGDDEDGDELANKLLQAFVLSQARYAVASIPVAGQAANAAIGQFTPERFDDRIGASPAYSAIEATVRAPKSIYNAVQGDGNPRAAVRDGLTAVGVLTGIPVGPLVRPLGYLADDERDGLTIGGLLTGKTAER